MKLNVYNFKALDKYNSFMYFYLFELTSYVWYYLIVYG